MDTALNREALLEGQKKHWSAVTPMGRLGRPDELNGLAVFLASDASGFVTGAEILADVGSHEPILRDGRGRRVSNGLSAGRLCGVLKSRVRL